MVFFIFIRKFIVYSAVADLGLHCLPVSPQVPLSHGPLDLSKLSILNVKRKSIEINTKLISLCIY